LPQVLTGPIDPEAFTPFADCGCGDVLFLGYGSVAQALIAAQHNTAHIAAACEDFGRRQKRQFFLLRSRDIQRFSGAAQCAIPNYACISQSYSTYF
jgi:hypothetical protein